MQISFVRCLIESNLFQNSRLLSIAEIKPTSNSELKFNLQNKCKLKMVQIKIFNVLFNPKFSLILTTMLQVYAHDILTWSPCMTGRFDPLQG
jgi:hypothetical protein